MNGVCKYCGKYGKLINSHVIPRSFYQLKKWGPLTGIDAKKITLDMVHSQNGFKEYLLCKECDNKLGYLDRYAYKFLFEEVPQARRCLNEDLPYYQLFPRDFNYNNIRRFFISLLWRASVSTEIPYSLGVYENIALQILKHEHTDNDDLFVPLIYRREIHPNLDVISGILSKSVMGNVELCLGFPGYQVIFIKDFRASKDFELAEKLRPLFGRKGIQVYCIKSLSVFERAFLYTRQLVQEKYSHLNPYRK